MFKLLQQKNKLLIGAHRGASNVYPENTITAFQEAVKQGCDYIELDVQTSKDGIPIVIHNPTIDDTTNGTGNVRDYTWEELGSFVIPYSGGRERIPSLEEVLLWGKKQTYFSIELKETAVPEDVAYVIEQTNMQQQVQVMSFDHHAVKRFKQAVPSIPAGIIFMGRLIDMKGAADAARADIINTSPAFLTPQDIQDLHDSGFFLCGSMSDDPAVWGWLQEHGADMVDTNIPGQLAGFLKANQACSSS